MKKIKTLMPIFLLILFAMAVAAVSHVSAASPEEDFKFDGEGTITGYKGPGGDVVIPSFIGGVDVTAIGKKAFFECTSLESVTIPDGVTSIGVAAFNECVNLEKITIPDGVISIGCCAFHTCEKLKSITIPDSVTHLGARAFSHCKNLESITIPNGVTHIYLQTFYYCTSLESITIPDSVKHIGYFTFSSCKKLEIAKFRGNAPDSDYWPWVFNCSNNFKVGYLYGNDTFEITDGKWEGYPAVPLFTVTYNDNGSESGDVPVDENLYEMGDTVQVQGNTGALAKAGYSFVGWNTAADGSGTSYKEGDTFTIDQEEHITLYPQWIAIPELKNAVAGNKKVELTWSPAENSKDYNVYVSTTSGSYDLPASSVTEMVYKETIKDLTNGSFFGSYDLPANTVTEAVYSCNVTGLTNGTKYYFVVTASNQLGESSYSNELSATPRSSSSGNSGKTTSEEIFINGKSQSFAVTTTKQEDNKTVTTVVLDDEKLEEQLESEDSNTVVTIQFSDDVDTAIGTLSGQSIKSMGETESVLEIKTSHTTYTLPVQHIDIDEMSETIEEQVKLEDIKVSIEISEPDSDTVKIIQDTADKNNYQIVVEPVTFEITCSYGDETVEISSFNAYTERMIAIPESIDPSSVTTAVILNSDGTFSHVPTVITMIDGKYYAKISSMTNSTYLVIENQKKFKDIENHWAKDALNDMGSRLIVSGVRDDVFEPDIDITRAEFTAIVVRGLGLMHVGNGKDIFSDVTAEDWYYDAVSIAHEYGIIFGYDSGRFGPMDKITREQAMAIVARVMEKTGLKIELSYEETDQILKAFNDSNMLADYAIQGSAACIKAGIVIGRNNQLLAPKDNITRAEAVVLIRRLLQASGLI